MRKQFSTNVNDEYYTPQYAVNILKPYLKDWKTIWCPFDEEHSNYVTILKELGYDVKYTHINTGQDFLTYEPDFNFDVIISNPPFSIKNKVLQKCYGYEKPFCLLLPYTMFFAKSTVKLVSNNVQFLMIDDRITYNGTRANFNSWYIGGNKFFDNDINVYLFEKSPLELFKLENK